MSIPDGHIYEFGPFRLDPTEGQLMRDGMPVTLTPKSFEALVLFVERRGHLISKEELVNALWPSTFVEEANLAHHVWRLRKVLEEANEGEKYIETVPKRGYRFVAEVRSVNDVEHHQIIEQHNITRLVVERETELGTDQDPASKKGAQRGVRTRIALVVSLGIGLLALLLGGSAYLRTRSASSTSSPKVTTLAVLPFKPLINNSSDASLELGMADALITRLSNLKDLTVRPTSAVMKYASTTDDSANIGRELRVQSVLEGRVQQFNDRIRVTVQLINSEDGKTIWAERFDEKFGDIFAL